jgi:non-heme chloroperoxidase
MNRRDLFRCAVATAVGGRVASGTADASQSGNRRAGQPARRPQAPFVETRDGAALFYREWGTGTPVVFVHSWSTSADLWQYQMIHLAAQGKRCIAYDQRGHGRSSDPGRGYDYDTLADDLDTVIATRDLREITLVGHSMGCGALVRYLTRHGSSRVAGAVLVAPTLPFMLKTPDNPDGVDRSYLEKVRALWQKDLPKWLMDNARPFFGVDASPALVEWGVRMSLQASLEALIECHRATTETDFRPELPRVTVPTIVIQGDADVSAPLDRTGRRTASLIPGCTIKVYEGAPHGLMFSHVDRLNADMISFIEHLRSPVTKDHSP